MNNQMDSASRSKMADASFLKFKAGKTSQVTKTSKMATKKKLSRKKV